MADIGSFLESKEKTFPGFRNNFNSNVVKRFDFSNDTTGTSKDTLKVYLRLKPLNDNYSHNEQNFFVKDDRTVFTYCQKRGNRKMGRSTSNYSFTKVFGPEASQSDLFQEVVAKVCLKFIFGTNCLLFTYGSTSSGKTYTIKGTGSNPGIIPRTLVLLFKSIEGKLDSCCDLYPDQVQTITRLNQSALDRLAATKARIFSVLETKSYKGTKVAPTMNDSLGSYQEMEESVSSLIDSVEFNDDVLCTVWVSFFEIYNENVYDLLDCSRKATLSCNSDRMAYVRGLQYVNVNSGAEAFKVFLSGKNNLHNSATLLNKCSSRSHSIFTIKLVKRYPDNSVSASSFSICDLAGTERQKKVQSEGGRLKECQSINTSHLVLNRCFKIIRENQKRKEKQVVPYRDSKLTHLFQRALAGDEEMIMIVNISQSTDLLDETLQVLKSSAIALEIEVQPSNPIHPSRRKSRFLTSYANRCLSIQWEQEALTEELSEKSCEQTSNENSKKVQELTILVANLRSEFENEKITLERNLRHELCTGFKEIMAEMELDHKKKLAEAYSCCDACNENRLFGLGKRKRTHHNFGQDQSADSDPIMMSIKQDYVRRVQELQDELSESQERIAELTDTNHQLKTSNINLQYQLSFYKSDETVGRIHFEKLVKDLEDDQTKTVIENMVKENDELKRKHESNERLLEIAHQEVEELTKNIYKLECKSEEQSALLEQKDIEIENLKAERQELEELVACKEAIINRQRCEEKSLDGDDLSESFVSLKLDNQTTQPIMNSPKQTLNSMPATNCLKIPSEEEGTSKLIEGAHIKVKQETEDTFDTFHSKLNICSDYDDLEKAENSERLQLLEMSLKINELKAENQSVIDALKKAESDLAFWKKETENELKQLRSMAIQKEEELSLHLKDLNNKVNVLQKDLEVSHQIAADLERELGLKSDEIQRLEFDHKTFLNNNLCKLEEEMKIKEKLLMESAEDKKSLENYINQCDNYTIEIEALKTDSKQKQDKLISEIQLLKKENKTLLLKVKTLESNIGWLEAELKENKSTIKCVVQSASDEDEDPDFKDDLEDDNDDSAMFVLPKPKTSARKRVTKKKHEDELPSYSFRSKTKSDELLLEKPSSHTGSSSSKRVGRKLFSKDSADDELKDVKSVEQIQSSPGSFMKRSLRSRKN